MTVQRVFSGAPWESEVGYCQALRAGSLVFVTGTVPVALAMGFGLLFATPITLALVPSLYLIADDQKRAVLWFGRQFTGKKARAPEAAGRT